MCTNCNPCFCCNAEVGIYILSMTHSLYITAAFVLGLALGYETVVVIVLQSSLPLDKKAFHLVIFIWYLLCFLAEVALREYLYKTLELNKDQKIQRCRCWIRLKFLQIVTAIPFICLHLYIEPTDLKITLYTISSCYHLYYVWVVHHYMAFEINYQQENTSPLSPSTHSTTITTDPGIPLASIISKTTVV